MPLLHAPMRSPKATGCGSSAHSQVRRAPPAHSAAFMVLYVLSAAASVGRTLPSRNVLITLRLSVGTKL